MGRPKAKQTVQPVDMATKVLREVRKAEAVSGDGNPKGGTGYTILKLRQTPIARLIDDGKIGGEELQAAQEIETAFAAIASRLMIRSASLERIDRGSGDEIPMSTLKSEAIANYQSWASHWSRKYKLYGDPMLQIIVAVVIDQRSIREIAADLGFHRARIEKAVIAGLRDYASRAPNMVDRRLGAHWMDDAERVFGPENRPLYDAVRRARIEL